MGDWDVAAQIKPQSPSDVIAPLTAFSNMALARARAQEVGLQGQQIGATLGAKQGYLSMVKAGTSPEDAVTKSGLAAYDPTGADAVLKGVQTSREIGAVRNYNPNDPVNSLKAGGPGLVKTGVDVQQGLAGVGKTQADTAQTQAATQKTQAETQAQKMEMAGQIATSFLAGDKSVNSWNRSLLQSHQLGLLTTSELQNQWGKPNVQLAQGWAALGQRSVENSGIADLNKGKAKAATTIEKLSPGETIQAAPAAEDAMRTGQINGSPAPGGSAPAGLPVAYTAPAASGRPVQVDAQGRATNAPGPQTSPQPVGQGGYNPATAISRAQREGWTDLATPAQMAQRPGGAPAIPPMFSQAASAADGFSPAGLARVAQVESGMNPNAVNGHAAGLMQFMPATWQQYGKGSPFDPQAATEGAQRLAADNKRVLTQALGRAPTDAELYLAHQQGPGGAVGLLSNPNAPAASVIGMKALISNGGSPNQTAGEFARQWIDKFNSPTRIGSVDLSGPVGGRAGPAYTMPQSLQGPNPQAPGQPVGASAAPPAPPSALMPMPPQPGAGGPPGGQGASSALPGVSQPQQPAPVPTPAAAPPAPTLAAAQPAAQAPGVTAPRTGLAADAAAAPLRAVAGSPMTVEQMAQQRGQGEENVKQIAAARDNFQTASSGMQNVLQLDAALAKIPEGGGKGVANSLLAPGPGATERIGLAKEINTWMSAAGVKPAFDPGKIAAAEESQKVTGRLGFDLSRSLGAREAASVVQQAISLNPGVENSPQGARYVSGSIKAGLQRQRDFYLFQQDYMHQNGGSPQGAEIAFDKAHPVSSYVHDVPRLASVPQQATVLLQQHQGDPRAAAAFDKTYGAGLSRYYLGQ